MMRDKASGYGLVRFDKTRRTITIECWPFLEDPADPNARQFPGWPVTISQLDNAPKMTSSLPKIACNLDNPVVQVVDEATSRIVYTLRLRGKTDQPMTPAPGRFTLRISDGEGGKSLEFSAVESRPGNDATLEITL
jgi:hypothetical protein